MATKRERRKPMESSGTSKSKKSRADLPVGASQSSAIIRIAFIINKRAKCLPAPIILERDSRIPVTGIMVVIIVGKGNTGFGTNGLLVPRINRREWWSEWSWIIGLVR